MVPTRSQSHRGISMKLRLLASAVLVAAASASTTGGNAHAAVAAADGHVHHGGITTRRRTGSTLTLTRPGKLALGRTASLTGSYSELLNGTHLHAHQRAAVRRRLLLHTALRTYAGTNRGELPRREAPSPTSRSPRPATCQADRPTRRASKVAHLKTQIAAAPAAHTGCTQGARTGSPGSLAAAVQRPPSPGRTPSHPTLWSARGGMRAYWANPRWRDQIRPDVVRRPHRCTRPSTSAGSSPLRFAQYRVGLEDQPHRHPLRAPSQTPPLPRRQPDPKRRARTTWSLVLLPRQPVRRQAHAAAPPRRGGRSPLPPDRG